MPPKLFSAAFSQFSVAIIASVWHLRRMNPDPESISRKRPSSAEGKAAPPTKTAKKSGSALPQTKGNNGGDSKGNLSLSSLLTENGWKKALKGEMKKEYFVKMEADLNQDLKKGLQIFPPKDLIFNAFNLTPLKQVKVVILGQDPYHDDDQAHGLSFSVPKGVKMIPPSLRNMFKELADDVTEFSAPDHGCLEKWARQGVFLLNTTLTVEAHKANSHKLYGWQTFTDEVIRALSEHADSTVVFLLWGNFAHKKEKLIDVSRHVVLKDAHPSPLSFGKFHGCRCFSRANQALKKAGRLPVDWTL